MKSRRENRLFVGALTPIACWHESSGTALGCEVAPARRQGDRRPTRKMRAVGGERRKHGVHGVPHILTSC